MRPGISAMFGVKFDNRSVEHTGSVEPASRPVRTGLKTRSKPLKTNNRSESPVFMVFCGPPGPRQTGQETCPIDAGRAMSPRIQRRSSVGRTPSSARLPLEPPSGADQGVGAQAGGPAPQRRIGFVRSFSFARVTDRRSWMLDFYRHERHARGQQVARKGLG